MIIEARYRCTNPGCCSRGVPQELDVVVEQDTGAKYLLHEDRIRCQDCGHEMEEAD
jgi:DNA-directed RNA polymerase subunit RPC12/RpoP